MTQPLIVSGEVRCLVRYSRRKTLGLYVFRDGRVELRAPHGCPEHELRRFLDQRLDWVRRKLAEAAELPQRARRSYEEGEPQPYLGKCYPLTIVEGRPYGVWLAAERLTVRARAVEEVPHLLAGWYRQQALTVFAQRLERCFAPMAELAIPYPTLRVRAMRSRWGSCSRRGVITLNTELVKYPLELIDYVVVHELCHLREFNHSPRFYALMDRFLPGWPARKQELNRLAGEMPLEM